MAHTLSDFLLARIAEDEEVAHLANREINERGHILETDVATSLVFNPDRILIECEAKRRTVEQYRTSAKYASRYDDNEDWAVTEALRHALSWLALPYADHPDFRDEWGRLA